ncbi:hypothetical protein Tco_1068327 [Tanacetum coccineum]|uniref:Transposase n=1 Tax=Tanacetum coccineum TaxID=301880 RepID=A0ABQ5HHB6_9ASTR
MMRRLLEKFKLNGMQKKKERGLKNRRKHKAMTTLIERKPTSVVKDLYHLYRVVQDYYEHIPPTGLGLILLGDLTIIWETADTYFPISDGLTSGRFKKKGNHIKDGWFHESQACYTLVVREWALMITMHLAERRYPLSRELMIRMLIHGMDKSKREMDKPLR